MRPARAWSWLRRVCCPAGRHPVWPHEKTNRRHRQGARCRLRAQKACHAVSGLGSRTEMLLAAKQGVVSSKALRTYDLRRRRWTAEVPTYTLTSAAETDDIQSAPRLACSNLTCLTMVRQGWLTYGERALWFAHVAGIGIARLGIEPADLRVSPTFRTALLWALEPEC